MFSIKEYKEKIDNFYGLMDSNKDIVDIKISDEKWTLKEMIGHLIDSASNNHQRFVRLQIDKKINFPAYEPEIWKNISKIKEYCILDLLNLWKGYNYFLLHLIQNISKNDFDNVWEIYDKEMSLKFIIEDYFGRHMDWHIELYKDRIKEITNEIFRKKENK